MDVGTITCQYCGMEVPAEGWSKHWCKPLAQENEQARNLRLRCDRLKWDLAAARNERDEARQWARKLKRENDDLLNSLAGGE